MRIDPPDLHEIESLLGPQAHAAWQALLGYIGTHYEMETFWSTGGKAGPYEYKYRRGGKTLCALYPRQDNFGFMVVLGRAEQEKFEAAREGFTPGTRAAYDATHPYHDGRWLMLEVAGPGLQEDMAALLNIKRRPNKK